MSKGEGLNAKLHPHPEPVEGWDAKHRNLKLQVAMQIYVYMLRCSDGSYYVGLTRDGLDKRVAEHQDGRYPGYTHTRRPVKLVWSQDFQWLRDAIACERRLKGWRREKKEALMRGDYEALSALSKTAKRPRPSTGSG